tara:strand:- start:10260 stop:10922 length:663 start_codon:yes stop_codon:yes gene_type:complete
MIVPNMQTRFTGYNSQGTGNLLNAVMQKRQQDITEDMAAASRKLQREGMQLQRDLAADRNSLTSQGLAQQKDMNDAQIKDLNNRIQQRLADNAYRDKVFNLSNQLRQEDVKYKKGLAVEGINKAISEEGEADRQRNKTKFIENSMKNPFNIKSEAELGVEFDKLAPEQKYEPNMERLIGSSPNVAPNSNVGQMVPQDQRNQTNFLNMLMLNQLGNMRGQY